MLGDFYCGYCATHRLNSVKISKKGKKDICTNCNDRREKQKNKRQKSKDYRYARAKKQYQDGTMPIPD